MNAVAMTICKECAHNYWLLESWRVPYMFYGSCPKCECSNVFFANKEAEEQWEKEKPTDPEHPTVYHTVPEAPKASNEAVDWLEGLYKLQDLRTARRIRAGTEEI